LSIETLKTIMMVKFSEIYKTCTSIGTKNLTDISQKIRVHYSDVVTISSILFIGLPVLLLSIFCVPGTSYISVIFILGCLFALLLQYFYFTTAGRYLISLLPISLVSIFHVLIRNGEQPAILGITILSLACIMIPFIVFSLKETRYLIFSELSDILIYILVSNFGHHIFEVKDAHLYQNNLFISLLILFSLAIFIYYTRLLSAINQKSEIEIDKLHIKNSNAIQKNEELQKRLDEAILEMETFKNEQEKLKELEKQREWINSGITKFVDILRLNNNNIKELTYSVISNLVKYLNANQGGIYMLSDEKDEFGNITFDMTATYAYDKRKFINKKISLGEGLIGSCAMEKKFVHLVDIPEDYIKITSGLGDASPRNLLLIPIINENEVYGVIEIASFNEFKQYEIEFVEKVAENIGAGVISTIMQNKTNDLITEMKKQAEISKTQEEELRQNVEEMQATQEEMQKKESLFREFAAEMGIDDNILNERLNM